MFSELKKALTSSGDGAALVPYDLEATLHEELLKLQPLAELISVDQAEGKTHEYNIRTSHPLGWFEGETTGANNQNGAYARKTVQLKIQRIWGSVTGFAQKVDEAFINALAEELNGSLEGMANLMEFGLLWGCANDIGFTGDAYQYSGLIPRIFAYAPENVVDAGGDKVSLDDLDSALAAASKFRQTRNDPRLWIMGLRMNQVVAGLQTKVQLPLSTAQLNDGQITMSAYGKAAILESDYVVPASTSTSPATTGVIAAGGTLADGTYTYKISSVTMYGEQIPGTASANVVAASTNKTANLTWTHDDNAKLYMIWRQLSTGGYFLLDVIPALTYDADGKVNGNVEAYSDSGSKTVSTVIKPLASGEQNIVLLNMSPARGISFVGMVDDMGRPVGKLMSFVELARIKDSYDYFIKGYMALKVKYPNVHAIVRHCKLS
jgi:hypothetical protein